MYRYLSLDVCVPKTEQIAPMTYGLSPGRLRDEIVLILGSAFVDPSVFLDDDA
jgi:hypothetical protein